MIRPTSKKKKIRAKTGKMTGRKIKPNKMIRSTERKIRPIGSNVSPTKKVNYGLFYEQRKILLTEKIMLSTGQAGILQTTI